jgi:Spy/CpxP family protein refolding chaperone
MLLAGAAGAEPQHGGPRGQGPATMLAQRLQLTPLQQTQVKDIFAKHMAEARARHEAFEASLTPEQKAERDARRQEWEARRASGEVAQRGPAQERPEPTPEQRARMQKRHQQMQAEMQGIDAEIQAVLTPEQRTVFEQMKAEGPGRRAHGGDSRG